MQPTFTPIWKTTALLFCLGLFAGPALSQRTGNVGAGSVGAGSVQVSNEAPTGANGCPSTGAVSQQQRRSLKTLPNDVQIILDAVRRQNQTTCLAPATGAAKTATIDPLSLPANDRASAPSTAGAAVPDEVVAMIAGDGSNIAAIARTNGLSVRSQRQSALLGGFIVRFGIDDGRTPASVSAMLQASGTINTPGPNHLYQLQGSAFEGARYAPAKIGWPTTGVRLTGKDVLIGVIDTAIDLNHPDLKSAVLDSFDALPDQPVLSRRHGTAVAGLVAGRSMIKGVAPQARLLVARAFDEPRKNRKASSTTYQILEALDWTVAKGARIVNMSFTGPRNDLLSNALSAAAKKNVLLIAAAGNHGPNAPPAYPAAEQSVLAVTAIDVEDHIYQNANVGAYVFVAAPGVDVLAAVPDSGVDMVSGTSFAAPFLSGLAALMLERNSALTPLQFARILELTSLDLGQPGRDQIFGVGLANLSKALANLTKALASPSHPLSIPTNLLGQK